MTGLAFLRGLLPVARHELLVNLKSARSMIMIVVLALIVVGGAYGIGRGTGGGGPFLSPLNGWGHPAIGPSGEDVAVVWVSDPFGAPLADTTVTFLDEEVDPPLQLGSVNTDADGFSRLAVGNRSFVSFSIRTGNAELRSGVFFPEEPSNFTFVIREDDLDNDGLYDDFGIHVLARDGVPALARLYHNDTFVTTVDGRGYGRMELPPGRSNVTIEVAGEQQILSVFVMDRVQTGFASGPDFVLLVIATVFATFVVPIFAIVITFDAISKERVQGTLDLLLSRPASRVGTLLGKFVGTFVAVAVPVTVVNLAGIGVLAAVSGKPPTGSFAAAFLGLELLLIAFYIPLQLIFSTLAKTSGTAILFGILVWLAFNVLYPVITLVLSSLLFPNSFEAQFRFLQVAGVGNPSSIYQQLVAFAAPESLRFSFGAGSVLTLPAVAAAAVVWLTMSLGLAMWVFHHKAAE